MIDPREKISGKIILVTGGAGFIGSHLCDRLLHYGARVICFDDLSTGSKEYIRYLKNNNDFIFIKGDANEMKDIAPVFQKNKIAYVFHYAALVGVQRTIENPLEVLKDIEGIKNILALSEKHKIKKIVYASSSEIYGNQKKMPLNEDRSYLDIKMPYAMVKSAGENYFRIYWEMLGLPFTGLRFFNVYGPRQISSRYGFVTGIFISQVLRGENPTIFHDGKQTRDFMYIADNVEASIQALLNSKSDGELINLGTGREVSILDLAKKVIALSGRKLKPSLFHERNLIEIRRRVADNAKMLNKLGYKPKYPLDKGLRLTYEWYSKNMKLIKPAQLNYSTYRKRIWIPRKNRSSF